MKRAFTLVEMLVVVAVLAILMTIVFRLGSVIKVDEAKNVTISRMQKLENCLSGYYAAFGSYPPITVQGSRDIYVKDDDKNRNESLWGWQNIGDDAEIKAWNQVRRACMAQPVECRFPFSEEDRTEVQAYADELKLRTESGEFKYYKNPDTNPCYKEFLAGFSIGNPNNFSKDERESADWNQIKLFRYGLMSYLLPRYLVMMNGDERYFDGDFEQWEENNDIPSNPFTGKKDWDWKDIRNKYLKPEDDTHQQRDLARVANIPSQAVTARWMPNLEGICTGGTYAKLFGIVVSDGASAFALDADPDSYPPSVEIYSPGGSGSGYYILDKMTVTDGWSNDFYYYSRSPFQSYTLWSSGPNGRTFPVWMSIEKLDKTAQECVLKWTVDDLTRMKNN